MSRSSEPTAAVELNWQYGQYLQLAQQEDESRCYIEQAVALVREAQQRLPDSTTLRQRLIEYSIE